MQNPDKLGVRSVSIIAIATMLDVFPLWIQDQGLPVSHKFLGLFIFGCDVNGSHAFIYPGEETEWYHFHSQEFTSLGCLDDTRQVVKSSSSLKIESKAVCKTYRAQSEKPLFYTTWSIRAGQADLSTAPIHEPYD